MTRGIAIAALVLMLAAGPGATRGDAAAAAAAASTARVGSALVARGKYAEALELLAAVPPDTPTPWPGLAGMPGSVSDWRVAAHLGLGRTDEALAVLSDTMDADPVAACLAGDVYERVGDFDAAARFWTRGSCAQRLAELEAVELRPSGPTSAEVAWTSRVVARRQVPAGVQIPYDEALDLAAGVDAPAAFGAIPIVRAERDHDRVGVLTEEGRREGDVSRPGSYLLSLSLDGGHTFTQGGLLGIARGLPYVLRPRSRVAMLDGSFLHVEALHCPPAPGSDEPGDWPCPTGVDPVASVLTFHIPDVIRPFDAWRRTADEARRRFGSPDEDSDGDGECDGDDASPRLPAGDRRRWVDSFLEWLVSDEARVSDEALVSPPEGSDVARLRDLGAISWATAQAGVGPPLAQEPLILLRLSDAPFFVSRGHDVPVAASPSTSSRGPRVLAVSELEAALLGWPRAPGFSVGYRARLLFDLDGSRALMDISFDESGGRYLAERTSEGWRLTRLGGWIS